MSTALWRATEYRGVGRVPEVGEIVLLVGDEKNRGEWTKGKVERHIQGNDGVVRGVTLLHKGHYIGCRSSSTRAKAKRNATTLTNKYSKGGGDSS